MIVIVINATVAIPWLRRESGRVDVKALEARGGFDRGWALASRSIAGEGGYHWEAVMRRVCWI